MTEKALSLICWRLHGMTRSAEAWTNVGKLGNCQRIEWSEASRIWLMECLRACVFNSDFVFLIALTSTVLIVSEARKLMSHLIIRRHSVAVGGGDASPIYYSVEDYVWHAALMINYPCPLWKSISTARELADSDLTVSVQKSMSFRIEFSQVKQCMLKRLGNVGEFDSSEEVSGGKWCLS